MPINKSVMSISLESNYIVCLMLYVQINFALKKPFIGILTEILWKSTFYIKNSSYEYFS